ncbi:hypothetical protein [Tellurirhabdus rosea]|uniref:hypothetical protein n=1 Tax=Tellurirhabdus rosea TaxID=2674997 RepID=UPI00225B71FB|nr:hypothetical protein [Tellurirhabdus rosea]
MFKDIIILIGVLIVVYLLFFRKNNSGDLTGVIAGKLSSLESRFVDANKAIQALLNQPQQGSILGRQIQATFTTPSGETMSGTITLTTF